MNTQDSIVPSLICYNQLLLERIRRYTYTIQYTCIHVYIYYTYTTYTIYNIRVYIYYTYNIGTIFQKLYHPSLLREIILFFSIPSPPRGGGKLKYMPLYSGCLLVCSKRCDWGTRADQQSGTCARPRGWDILESLKNHQDLKKLP